MSFSCLLNADALPEALKPQVLKIEACLPCIANFHAGGEEDDSKPLVLCVLRWDDKENILRIGVATEKGDRPVAKIMGDIGKVEGMPSNWFGSDAENDTAINYLNLPDAGGEFAISCFDWLRSLTAPEPSDEYKPARMTPEDFIDKVGKAHDQIVADGRAALKKMQQSQKAKKPEQSEARKPLPKKKIIIKKKDPQPEPMVVEETVEEKPKSPSPAPEPKKKKVVKKKEPEPEPMVVEETVEDKPKSQSPAPEAKKKKTPLAPKKSPLPTGAVCKDSDRIDRLLTKLEKYEQMMDEVARSLGPLFAKFSQ